MKLKSGLITFFLSLSTISLTAMDKQQSVNRATNDLVRAACEGDIPAMQQALDQGADINGVGDDMTVQFYQVVDPAAVVSNALKGKPVTTENIQYVINSLKGREPVAQYYREEYNALKIAIEKNQFPAVKFLVDNKADLSKLPEVQGIRGAFLNPATPLSIALGRYTSDEKNYNVEIIGYLLKFGHIKNCTELGIIDTLSERPRFDSLLQYVIPYLTDQLVNKKPQLAEAFKTFKSFEPEAHMQAYLLKIFRNGISCLEKLDTPTLKALSQTQVKEIVELYLHDADL